MSSFDYTTAFSRTIGLVTKTELETLRSKRIAIAGLGGVGGSHLLTLVRLGIGKFTLADMDTFALENFNRQVGANMSNVDRPKVMALKEMATLINPTLEIKVFPEGISSQNIDAFLQGVDLYVDGLDFFAFGARRLVFERCYQLGIPAITVGPVGMGAALINFLPGRLSFVDYFNWRDSDSDLDLAIKFLIGLSPKMPHYGYIVDPSAVDLANKRGPSTPMACEMCSGVAGTEALKILLKRGKVSCAPRSIVFDAYTNRLCDTWMFLGNRNPLQRIKIWLAKKIVASRTVQPIADTLK